jgi:hypothetical protein
MRLFLSATLLAVGCALFSSSATAAIIINTDQSGSGSLGTVSLPGGTTGLLIQGTADSGALLNFTGTETLTAPSNGQARIEAVDGQFTTMTIAFSLGQLFDRIVFNLDAAATGTLTVTAFNQNNVATVQALGLAAAGQNFINVDASGADLISRIQFTSTVGITDIAQVRVDAIAGNGGIDVNAVPEPSTFGLIGSGLLGLGFLRRRK